MSRVLPRPLGSRRSILLLLLVGAALLVTLGLFVDTSSRPSGSEPGAGTEQAEPGASSFGSTSTAPDAATDPAIGGAVVDPATAATAEGDERAPEDAARAATGGAAAPLAAQDAVVGSDVAPAGGGLDAPSIDAKIIRTASIELRLRRGGFEEGWSDAQAVAAAHGGYIVSASRSGAGDSTRLGTITMRVPTGKFDPAVDRLRDLDRAKVERLDVSSQDVTQEFVDTRSRLRHDRAVEGRLLALLAQTDGVSEVLAVQARLDQVQEQIEVSRGRLEYLEKLTSMSSISLTLRAPASGTDDRDADEGSVLGDAWADARERFAENVAAAIVWIGGALPALVVLGVALLAGRLAWRRRFARTDASTRPDPQA